MKLYGLWKWDWVSQEDDRDSTTIGRKFIQLKTPLDLKLGSKMWGYKTALIMLTAKEGLSKTLVCYLVRLIGSQIGMDIKQSVLKELLILLRDLSLINSLGNLGRSTGSWKISSIIEKDKKEDPCRTVSLIWCLVKLWRKLPISPLWWWNAREWLRAALRKFRWDVRITERGLKHWKTLPREVIKALSLSVFRKCLDNTLKM